MKKRGVFLELMIALHAIIIVGVNLLLLLGFSDNPAPPALNTQDRIYTVVYNTVATILFVGLWKMKKWAGFLTFFLIFSPLSWPLIFAVIRKWKYFSW